MINFCTTHKRGENFTPASLIYRYAKENNLKTFYSYGSIYIVIRGMVYGYYCYAIEGNDDSTETVTVFLALKER